MPMMCEECKCSNWLCSTCGESNHHDCDCTCCGCQCQRQDSTALAVHIDNQPTERSNTMETISEAVAQSAPSLADEITNKIATLEAQVNTLRDSLYREREHVRNLFTTINDDIESNGWSEDDTLTLQEVSDYLLSAFSSQLVFLKEYEAEIRSEVVIRVRFKASSESDAQALAESIEPNVYDHDINHDGEMEIDEVYLDETKVHRLDTVE